MLKPVKPRGDTSVAFLSTGLYISEPAKSATEYTIRPEHDDKVS